MQLKQKILVSLIFGLFFGAFIATVSGKLSEGAMTVLAGFIIGMIAVEHL